jgi:hypothetical protein
MEAKARAEAEAKLRQEEADRLAREKAAAAAAKAKADKAILPTLSAVDPKYKDAVKRADGFFASKRYYDAKIAYQEALNYKGGDPHARERLLECEKIIGSDESQKTDERLQQLLAKYPPGVSEETIPGEDVVIIKRVLVKDKMAFVYEKKIFNWGGIACFRDGMAITELVFEQETKK